MLATTTPQRSYYCMRSPQTQPVGSRCQARPYLVITVAGCLPWAGSPEWSPPLISVPMAPAELESVYSHSLPASVWGGEGGGSPSTWAPSLNMFSLPRLQSRNPVVLTSCMRCGAGCDGCAHRRTVLTCSAGHQDKGHCELPDFTRAGLGTYRLTWPCSLVHALPLASS